MSLHVWDIFKDRNTFGLCVFPPRLSTRRMEALINITFQIVYFLACILMPLFCVWYFAWFAVRQSLVGESPPPKKKSREELIGEAYVIATLWINFKCQSDMSYLSRSKLKSYSSTSFSFSPPFISTFSTLILNVVSYISRGQKYFGNYLLLINAIILTPSNKRSRVSNSIVYGVIGFEITIVNFI